MTVGESTTGVLLGRLESARAESDKLFSIVRSGAIYERPIDARHRIIFYLGHLDGFDSIQICREALGIPSPDPHFDELFQAGIDPEAGQLPTDVPSDWPRLEQVEEYVQRCRTRVDRSIDDAPPNVLQMAVEHRLMHLETLAYMFHSLPYDQKQPPETYLPLQADHAVVENEWVHIPAGVAVLGKPRGSGFGWDNEFGEKRSPVPAFDMQRYPVTNGDYLRFVEGGAKVPHFWEDRGGRYFLRGMFEAIPLPLSWPVYVTQQQAEAYARWVGARLPNEEQFYRAAYSASDNRLREYPWGDAEPRKEHGNFDFRRWDPESVYQSSSGESAWGIAQLVGNGWEWTGSAFEPFPGFEPLPTYPGYSANFFDGKHFSIKGGSPRTASLLLRRSFRNWFRADYPYLYAKFRCVRSAE